ncbi:hypothetical protein HH310_06155 [Actinoplanes sp. TBRC 11911]|uniref:YncE family protein n=1 Tax=Actinoplanes sp. TBRC 11911 TaxID=2729386 RepID=UPI00145FB8FE|nr:hypothetical protein [Actinoplanes sp. TBRC 11911]NMO50776.1 hypothetical protein [Actinoplanes sp. TBRC 11911]
MMTRRTLLGGVVATAALAGCRERVVSAAPTGVRDVLLASTRQGLARIDAAGVRGLGVAEASRDGRFVYARSGDTGLLQLDSVAGAPVRSTTLGGGWVPRVVSDDGRSCALTRPRAGGRTPLLIAGPLGERTFDLSGTIEPDAFTQDGTGLFVLDWLPPTAPDRYRVRLLNLTTGSLEPLWTREKLPIPPGAEEEMRGEGRQAVLSADRQMLYTLYTHQPGHQHTRNLLAGTRADVHAFVHCLHLMLRWAYCLDLPHPFGSGPPSAYALAADDRHIAVLDASSGSLAYASTTDLTLQSVTEVPFPVRSGPAGLALSPDGRVMAAAGRSVTVLEKASPGVKARWTLPGGVQGMALSADGARLYAGAPNAVTWLDTATGTEAGTTRVNGLTALRHVT